MIKVGSNILTRPDGKPNATNLSALVDQIAAIRALGHQVILVSSGAVACGRGAFTPSRQLDSVAARQLYSSIGQIHLINLYNQLFASYGITVGQVLTQKENFSSRTSYLNQRACMLTMLEHGVLPIVNENDTVAIDEINQVESFGDNDTLAALVACLVDASLLVIASDIDGLYDANPAEVPAARLIPEVTQIDKAIIDVAGGAGSAAGSGGMQTKVRAARIMMAAGTPLAIVHGKAERAIVDTVEGACPGTVFVASSTPHSITPKKLWIALGDSSHGALVVDDGAKDDLVRRGSSLLAVGVCEVRGRFDEGDIIDVEDAAGVIIARGRAEASSDVIELACGKTSEELAANRLIGDLATKPIVHRDECMVFE